MSSVSLDEVFAANGPFARPGYQPRPGQIRLSKAVLSAMQDGKHLVAEGPCGVGKSLAYGVPAAHMARSGKRVLIVTASIALQEQLVSKDLPAMKAALGWDFSWALIKGRSNYLCKAKLDEYIPDNSPDSKRLTMWSEKTKAGDKSELTWKPSDVLWSLVSSTSDECTGTKCAYYNECYATKAKDAAAKAGIVVTNYHMFLMNVAMGGCLLPPYDYLILDEAHECASIARDVLGYTVTRRTFERFAKDAGNRHEHATAQALRTAADYVFDTVTRFAMSGYYKDLVRGKLPISLASLEKAVATYAALCDGSPLVDNALVAMNRIKGAFENADANCVYTLEVYDDRGGRKACRVKARYVEPAVVLAGALWGETPCIAVSATITTDGKFDFAKRELGAGRDVRECIVETPFDFQKQAMLVLPEEICEPNDPSFGDDVAHYVLETIDACGGRTMGLFTSYQMVIKVAEKVRQRRPTIKVLCQGDMPVRQLVEEFKKGVNGGVVLLGTTSLWTGVDVQGEALTGLVIDRLPFTNPNDPVTIRIAEKDPRGAFAGFSVPEAILRIRQGVGRLIRSTQDRGVVVLLDKRLRTKGYGARFLKSLPDMRRGNSIGEFHGLAS